MSGRAIDLDINAADPDQRYIAFTNGFLHELGSALAVPQATWQDAVAQQKAPTWFGGEGNGGPLRAIHIIDWDTPSGYTIDQWGFLFAWGGVDECPGGPGGFFTDAADYFFGLNGGFQSPTFGFVSDFVMDPAGNGTGYFLTLDGDVHAFGTGITAVAHSAFLAGSGAIATRLVMDWASRRYWVGDSLGRVHGKNGGNDRAVEAPGPGSLLPAGDGTYDTVLAFRYGRDCVGLELYDVTANAKGWMADSRGRVWGVGGADPATGFQPTLSSPIWADLAIVDDGQSTNPLRLAMINRAGTLQEWVSSTAPTVTVVEPADPTNDTTRPFIGWTYLDLQGDPQIAYELKVFDSATVAGMGFDPDTATPVFSAASTGNATRVRVDFDLTNDTYRAYVHATDSSNLTSDWAYQEWDQDVTPPATPTVTASAAADVLDGISLALHVDPTDLDPAACFAVQQSDDGGTTWVLTRGGYDITPDGSGDATLIDLEAPFGAARTFRALVYVFDEVTEAWVASSWSDTDSAALDQADLWALTNPLDTSQGGAISPSAMFVPQAASVAAVFVGAGRTDPVVISDGVPKLPAGQLSMWALDADEKSALEELIAADTTLLLRDPLANARFVRRAPGAVVATTIDTSNAEQETHELALPLQQVRRPSAAPALGPLAEA